MISGWSYSPETPNLGQNRWFFEPCDLAIWRMTLKNSRAPLLCYFKLCASFRSHRWFQTWVTVRKRTIWVKFDNFWKCFGVLWVNSYQLVLISRSHARVSMHCYPIGCVIKSTHRGICRCSPIVNFLKFTFNHGMVSSVIFLIKK